MRRLALLSIMTLYHHDETVFDPLEIPTEPSPNPDVEYTDVFRPDKETAIAAILMNCAELEIVYSSPEAMKDALHYWSIMMLPKWQRFLDTMLYKYNPIWNVDGTEKRTLTYERTGDENTTSESIDTVAAFDTSGYSNRDKNNYTEDKPWSENHKETETHRRTGNIGVTMTQQMIERERQLAEFSYYDMIVSDFKKQFCLLIY